MEIENFKKAQNIQNRIRVLKEHLHLGSFEKSRALKIQTIEGTGLYEEFLPMPLDKIKNLYIQNMQNEIIRLEDEFKNL